MWKRNVFASSCCWMVARSRFARRRDASLRQRDAIVDRLHRAAAEDLAGHELGRHDRGGELLEHRLAVAAQPEQQSGMNTGTSRASARRKSICICSSSGSGSHSGSDGLHQRRAELLAEHGLDLLGRRGDDRLLGLRARRVSIDSRMTPSRMPLSAPRAPARAWLAYGVRQHRRARHGRVGVARIVVASIRSFSASSTLAQSPSVRQWMPLRSQ